MRRPGPVPRPLLLGVSAALVVVLAAGGGYAWLTSSRRADERALQAAVESLRTAWLADRLADVAWAPAAPGAAEVLPAEAASAFTDALTSADRDVPSRVQTRSVVRSDDGAGATATLEVTWELDAVSPAAPWTYQTRAALRRTDAGRWQVAWSPQLLHPDLADGELLRAERLPSSRADVLGAGDEPIVTPRPVVRVGLQPSLAPDRETAARRLAAAVGVDADALVARAAAVTNKAVIPVITLRQQAFDAVRAQVEDLPGVVLDATELPLAPTSGFARVLLGSVGEATAEIVEESGGRVRANDLTGLSGLQRSYDEHLAGTAGVRVSARPSTDDDDTAERPLFERKAVDGTPLRLTLDLGLQVAAEAALAGAPKPAGLVAVRPSTGQVLAVANGGPDGAGFNRALVGQYPPGSTFKVVSTYALLTAGLDPDEQVPCPSSATVSGKVFTNYDDEAFGDVAFRRDFALSCNTAFVGLSDRISDADLVAAAAALGVGVEPALGAAAYTGSVPGTQDPVELAANMIGQGTVLASPLTMATVSAAVAAGRYTPPSLVLEPAPDPPPGDPVELDPEAAATLRELMRETVTDGTGRVLDGVDGPPVSAKTGTAEFGAQFPLRTHAWITGFAGDVAFAVVVEDGGTGGQVAGPLAADFLSRIAVD